MTLDKIAMKNEYIIHELIRHLEGESLRSLRQTCTKIEHILSTNSSFVKKAFHRTIYWSLELRHGYVTYGTCYLRQFIVEREKSAVEKYQFARKLILTSIQMKYAWKYNQGHVTNQSAIKMLQESQTSIKESCKKFAQIMRLEKHYGQLDVGTRLVNMRKHMLGIRGAIMGAEDDLTQIIKDKGEYDSFKRPKSWGLIRETDPEVRSYRLRHTAVYSAYILSFLLEELGKIQDSYIINSK